MVAVTITYIFGEPNIALGKYIPMHIAYIIGGSVAFISLVVYFVFLLKFKIFNKQEQEAL